MKKVFEKILYVAPRAEAIRFHSPLSVLNGGSGVAGLEGDYSDSGELEDATSFDDHISAGN